MPAYDQKKINLDYSPQQLRRMFAGIGGGGGDAPAVGDNSLRGTRAATNSSGGGMGPSPSFDDFINATTSLGAPNAYAPFEASNMPKYHLGRVSPGAMRQAEDITMALQGAQDKADRQSDLAAQKEALQNSILAAQARQANSQNVGGGIAGLQEGMDRNRQMSQQLFHAPSAYERASREKDFQEELRRRQLFGGIDLQQQLALQKQKVALAQQLFGQFSGGHGGGTLTNTDQQVVNNAGSWEPRTLTSTRQIPPTDIMAALSRFL